MKKRIFLTFLLIVAIILLPRISFADVGGGLDWDSNGWSMDGGGSSWDSDWDYGGNDDSWGGGNFYSFPFFSGGLGGSEVLIFIIIVIIFIYINSKNNNRKKYDRRDTSYSSGNEYRTRKKDSDDGITIEELKESDPNFSEGSMIAFANNVFIELQNAWTEKDWKKVRTFEADALFNSHKKQLDQYIDKKETNVVEDISIISTEFENFYRDEKNEYLSYILKARYKDYVIDDKNGNVIKGDKSSRYIMEYRMSFMRSKGNITKEDGDTNALTCPNCGAPVSINESGVCEYCGSYVSSGEYAWVLYQLEPLSQKKIN